MKPTTRAELAALVPHDGLIIELGVAKGAFAVDMLQANTSADYLGIDRWSDHHDGEEYAQAKALVEMMGGEVMRSTFSDALPLIPDSHADMIYIDGYAHTGQEGGETLRDWYPKLKSGGIFAGHDYDPQAYPQTVAAVDAFCRDNGLMPNIIDEKPHASWWLRKP